MRPQSMTQIVIYIILTCNLFTGVNLAANETAISVKAAMTQYRTESERFFSEKRTSNERMDFYRHWRDLLVEAAMQSEGTADACRALAAAEAISNSMGDYPSSAEIVSSIISYCGDHDAGQLSKGYWLVELGEVSRSAWESTRNESFFRKSFDAFHDALVELRKEPSSVETRILVTGWLGNLIESGPATHDDCRQVLIPVKEAITQFNSGFQPVKRLVGTGYDLGSFLGDAAKICIWLGDYDAALGYLHDYARLGSEQLSAAGIIVLADRSVQLHVADSATLDAYVRFLDKWLERPISREGILAVRMIPARRYYVRDELQEAKERFESLVNRHLDEINASSSRYYMLAEIWSALRSIYSRLGDVDASIDAARNAIKAKEKIGQSPSTEKSHIDLQKKKQEIHGDITEVQNDDSNWDVFRWNWVVGVILVTIGLFWKFRHSRKTSDVAS